MSRPACVLVLPPASCLRLDPLSGQPGGYELYAPAPGY